MTRTALVTYLKIISISDGSILQVGDTVQAAPFSNVLAVQREYPRYAGNEGALTAFPLFAQEIPAVIVKEEVRLSIRSDDPYIRVPFIEITGVSTSGIVHLGNTGTIAAQVRTKHIRQMLPETAAANVAEEEETEADGDADSPA